ncbi:MAG: phosphotransferase family protein [Pseudomonadota bacterium]
MTAVLLDAPGAVRDENAFDPAVILPFLKSQISDLPDGPLALQQFSGGASNLTYLLTVGGREMILRRPPPGTKAKSAHDMGREFRIMQRLQAHFPCPRPLAYSEDESLIGSPFYVMEKLAGVILRRDPPKGLSYSPEQAAELCQNLFDTQIQLHLIDYKAAGLDDLGKPEGYVGRQIKGWCERFEKAWTDDVPRCESIMAWLKAEQPADCPRSALIHNDYRFDNVVLSPADNMSIIGVLDWEMATLGDPLMDLGSSLAYWVEPGDEPRMQTLRMQPSQLAGMMTRQQIVEYYSKKTGIEVSNPDYYYVFGLFRLGVIAQQIYYRWKMGQNKNPRLQMFGMFVTVLSQVAEKVIARSK